MTMLPRTALISCCVLLITAATTPAQKTLGLAWGSNTNDGLGEDLRNAGDVDNDGIEDFIATAPTYGLAGIPEYARVFSGADGSTIWTFTALTPNESFAESACGVGDLNGDNHSDLLVGVPERVSGADKGAVLIYSGIDGSFMGSIDGVGEEYLGSDVCALGDIDNDQTPDFAVAMLGSAGSMFRVYSGATLSIAYNLTAGTGTNSNANKRVRSAGDVDNDGVPDVIVGDLTGGPLQGGEVRVYSLASGALLHNFSYGIFMGSPEKAGAAVATVGDIDADGHDDFIVGSPDARNPTTLINKGLVRIYSGQTGSVLHTIWADPNGPGGFGRSAVGLTDLNSDGVPEFAVGADVPVTGGPARVTVFSGATADVLDVVESTTSGNRFGSSIDTISDITGDGIREMIVADDLDTGTLSQQGAIHILNGDILASTRSVGAGCGAGPFVPTLGSTVPRLGTVTMMAGQNVPAGSSGWVLLALPLSAPINLGAPDCDLYTDPGTLAIFFPTPAGSSWSVPLPLPVSPVLTGIDIALQALYSPTGSALGYDLSNAVIWRFGH